MQSENHTQSVPRSRVNVTFCVLLLLLLGADFILTPHAPLHHLPQVGIYMLVTLMGIGAVLGVTLLVSYLLRRREDYYER
ncbi:MAG: hypothetical protein R6V18_08620 [Desulfuromonadaceae bacterium]